MSNTVNVTEGIQKATDDKADGGEADGEWDELNLPTNVYSVAFILANNATDTMYSFWPWSNNQMRVLWMYLGFISFSQTFALMALTLIEPPSARSSQIMVNCESVTSTQFRQAATAVHFHDSESCRVALDQIAFELPCGDETSIYRYASIETLFYENTLQGDLALIILQLVCCAWVMTHIYFKDFMQVELLMHFRDFNLWFLPQKGEPLKHNSWVLFIPMLQWLIATAVVTVSWCLISGYDDPVDVVLNSMAFTFITEVAETFAEPVLGHYAREAISGLDPVEYGTDDIFYIVTEYDPANDIGDGGWYISLDEKKVGLITDFRIRINTALYTRYHVPVVETLRHLFFVIPPVALLLCYLNTEGFISKAGLAAYFATLFCGTIAVSLITLWSCETHPALRDQTSKVPETEASTQSH